MKICIPQTIGPRMALAMFCAALFTYPAFASNQVTNINSPLHESVVIATGSFSELVHLSGFIHGFVKIAIPTEPCIPGDPCRNVPYSVHLNLQDVSGVGASSGLTYRANGAFNSQGLAMLPGGFSFETSFRVVAPPSIVASDPTVSNGPVMPIAGFVTLSADGAAQQADVTTGLVSHWAGDLDTSDATGLNPGTPVGQISYAQDGRVNEAFRFTGTGAVQVAQSASLEPATLTVATWVRHNGKPASAAYVVSKGAQGCTAASYGLYTGAGNLLFYVFDGAGFVLSPDAGTNVWDGNWHFIVGSYDGHAVRMYVDGLEVGFGTPTTLAIKYGLADDNKLYLGRYGSDACAGHLEADVDEVRLFNRVLSAAEVASMYSSQ